MSKRILYVIGSGKIGGREKFLFELLEQQKKFRNLLLGVVFLHEGGLFYDAIRDLDIDVWCLKEEKSWWKWKTLQRHLSRADIAIFKGYDLTTHLGTIGFRGKRIFHLTGERYSSPLMKAKKRKVDWGKGIENDVNITNKSSLIRRGYNFARRHIKYYGVNAFFLSMDKLVTPSEFLKQYIIKNFGIESKNIQVIYNFVNFDRLTVKVSPDVLRKELGLRKRSFVVGYAGRFDNRKRLDRLIRGFQQFCNLDDAIDKRLVLVGDGEPIRSLVEKLCKELNINEKVVFTGYQQNVPDYINLFDVFVLPSDSESFGLVVIEAMYLKKPIIVFKDSGGPLELIKDNVSGVIATTEEHLRNCLQKLAKDKLLYDEIAANAFKRSLDFDRVEITKAYTSLLLSA